jgi:hypothetical protein
MVPQFGCVITISSGLTTPFGSLFYGFKEVPWLFTYSKPTRDFILLLGSSVNSAYTKWTLSSKSLLPTLKPKIHLAWRTKKRAITEARPAASLLKVSFQVWILGILAFSSLSAYSNGSGVLFSSRAHSGILLLMPLNHAIKLPWSTQLRAIVGLPVKAYLDT